MYTDFSFVSMDTDIRNKTISLTFTMDIDPDTLSDATIEILERQSKNFVEYDISVQAKNIILTLKQWPLPNVHYILRVQNLKSVTGDLLTAGIRRPIIFVSNVLSTVDITYPAFNEQITDLKLQWIEKAIDNNAINSYYIEVSTENAFHNVLIKTTVNDRQVIDLKDLAKGQYYARVRAQVDNGSYGYWSEIITFIVGDNAIAADPIYNDEIMEDDPIYEEDLTILSNTEDNITPTSFIIEFDGEIDVDSIGNIIVMRRNV